MLPRQFDIHLSRDDYVVGIATVLDRIAREDRVRPKLLAARFVLMLAIMAMLFALFPASLPGVLAAALLAWIGEMLLAARFKGHALGVTFDPASSADTVVTFDDDKGIDEVASIRSRHWSWPAVRALHSTSGYLIIEMSSLEAIVLPDQLWAEPEDKAAFAADLRTRWPHITVEEGTPSEGATRVRVRLAEPVLIGRMALSLIAYQAAFEASLTLTRSPVEATTALWWIGAGVAAAIATWFATGMLFRSLTRRSPQAALITAWASFGLLALLLAVTWLF